MVGAFILQGIQSINPVISTTLGGYDYSSYPCDVNIRYWSFLKSVAIDDMEAVQLTSNIQDIEKSTGFNKETELLIFDM